MTRSWPTRGDHDVGRRIVAGDDHLGHQVAIGRLQSGCEGLEQTAAPPQILRADRVAFVQVERPRLRVPMGEHHDRDLDDAQRVHGLIGTNGDLTPAGKVPGVERGARRQRVQSGRHPGGEAGSVPSRRRAG